MTMSDSARGPVPEAESAAGFCRNGGCSVACIFCPRGPGVLSGATGYGDPGA